jgi:site-specific DNA-cytosine methylase
MLIDRSIDSSIGRQYAQERRKALAGSNQGEDVEGDRGDDGDEGDDGEGDGDESAGSHLSSQSTRTESVTASHQARAAATTARLRAVVGQVRHFSPNELLAIAGFPKSFEWPPDMPLKHCFACIGNSVNVTVVSAVMRSLFDR